MSQETADLGSVRARVRVSGHVQGVHFRAFAKDEAVSRKVAGWMRNTPAGGVEPVFEAQ